MCSSDLFKKIRDTKGIFHAKMGSIKDRNHMDLTEAEDIKKKWQEYTDQIRSVTQLCPTVCEPMNRSTPGLPVHHQLPEFTQTPVHRVSDTKQPSHPLSSPSPPAPIRVFSNESTLRIRWPKYWSFSFSISPSQEIPGPISFRMDWLDLLAVQGTLKSLFQHTLHLYY